MDYRLLSKFFKCENCEKRFKKLVNHDVNRTQCEECNMDEAIVIEESEFNREVLDRTYRIAFDHSNENYERQFHPRTDLFNRDPDNIYGDARRTPSRERVKSTTPTPTPTRVATSRPTPTPERPITTRANRPQQSITTRQPSIIQQIFIPFTVSPFHGSVRRQPMTVVFGRLFSDLGNLSPGQDFFMDNFSSNFSSNFEDPLTRIIFLQSMQNQPEGTPPTSKEILKKLKRFKMNEEFCKTNEKGVVEYPSCSVCLACINKDENTLLVPCGHMFHDQCINKWLEMHNTCPVCRYELPTDDQDYERTRLNRQGNNNINNSNNNLNSNISNRNMNGATFTR